MLTNRYEFNLTVNGEEKKLTYGELTMYSRHPDPELRAAVYKELFRVYGQDANILAQIYASRINDWKSEQVDLRHFKTPISARNLGNDVPDAAVDTMLEICKKNATVFQRYFKPKSKWLGLNPMRRSDVYAPLAPVDTDFPWDQGVTLVLDSFEKFSPLSCRRSAHRL